MGKKKKVKDYKNNLPYSGIKIAVAILSGDTIMSDTSTSFTEMFGYSMMQGLNMRWINPRVSRIETGRNMAASSVFEDLHVKTKIVNTDPIDDYLLFVDSDMVIPRDVVPRLLSRDVDIVGINCPKRGIPLMPVYTHDINGEWMDYKSGKLYEMDYIGMACTLIKTSVLKEMERPWFYAEFSEENMMTPIGEDICFSRAAREAGFKVYCDMDVSMNIGHITTLPLYLPKDYTEEMHNNAKNEEKMLRERLGVVQA
jgi:hypothetical protein